jgi:acetyl-CoA C-acetyltransferase
MSGGRVAVLSSAQTELRPAWGGAQHIDLISAVVSAVFKGTGLTLDDVDFVIDSGSDVLDGRSISNCGFLGAMGAHHKEESRVEEDGLWAATYGAAKIAAGGASLGLILAYSKPSESDVGAFYRSQCEPFYQRPVGFDHDAACGLQAQRYLAQHRLHPDDLAQLVASRWTDAAAHGRVSVDAAPTAAQVLSSPNAAAPLTRLMLARPVDGAVAVLLGDAEVARRAVHAPVWITGTGHAMDTHSFAARKPGTLQACEAAARAAIARAGWRRVQPSLVEISASSAVTELMVLEAAGLAAPGAGLRLCERGSPVAVNRSGGALPADPIMATGLVRLAEAARQLRHPGDYGLPALASRSSSPATALAHGAGGVGMQSHCVMTLEV